MECTINYNEVEFFFLNKFLNWIDTLKFKYNNKAMSIVHVWSQALIIRK